VPENLVAPTREDPLGLESIVRAAPKLNVLSVRLSARTVGHDVMKLQKCPLCASAPLMCHEGALPAVAGPYPSLDLSRNVTRPGDCVVAALRPTGAAFAGAVRGGELPLCQVLEQRRQRAIEDLADVAIRNL
jgi:hypothetical protein